MKMRIFLYLITLLPLWTAATGLQPIDTSASVNIQSIQFDLSLQALEVAGTMEIQLTAEQGNENAANLRFPLPPEAVLHRAEIFLPAIEKWRAAETVGRQEGTQIYQEIVQQQFDPLLIQRIGKDFYRARVYPVDAKGSLRLRVHYAHTLETVDDQYRLRIPFSHPDVTAATTTPNLHVALSTETTRWSASQWFIGDELATPTTVDLSNGTTSLNLEAFKMDQDITLDLKPTPPLAQATGLLYQPDALPAHAYVRWHPKLAADALLRAQPRNVVFVIDVSGSMGGDKIIQTRQAIISCLTALEAGDYFGLVAFDSQVYRFREVMAPARDVQTAIQWVAALRAGSSTAMSAGLTAGATIGATSPLAETTFLDLFLITDGLPNEGSSTVPDMLADISAQSEQLGYPVRIFSVGIGYDLDQQLLNGLAQQTQGASTFALADNEVKAQILDLFSQVRSGGLTDVTVSIQGLGEHTTFHWPALFPDKVLQLGIQGSSSINDIIELSLTGTGPDLSPVTRNTTVSLQPDQRGIAAPLAAKAWADRLERQIDSTEETNARISEAIQLARTYGIITRYSSLLALEDEAQYAEHGVQRIERDQAGIALQPVTSISPFDEGQIGGQGTVENKNSPPSTVASPISPVDDAVLFEENEVASGDTLSSGGEVLASGDTCLSMPTLDAQLHLYIPQLTYEGKYYWAKLQLVEWADNTLVLEVLDYGEVNQPVLNFSACGETILSTTLQVTLPWLYYQTATAKMRFATVELQHLPNITDRLVFEVVRYQLVN